MITDINHVSIGYLQCCVVCYRVQERIYRTGTKLNRSRNCDSLDVFILALEEASDCVSRSSREIVLRHCFFQSQSAASLVILSFPLLVFRLEQEYTTQLIHVFKKVISNNSWIWSTWFLINFIFSWINSQFSRSSNSPSIMQHTNIVIKQKVLSFL